MDMTEDKTMEEKAFDHYNKGLELEKKGKKKRHIMKC